MIQNKKEDIFTVNEGYIVHGCNAQGVMGSGIAALVKQNYPYAFEAYKNSGHLLGTNSYYIEDGLCIVNAVTQEYYGRDGKRYTDYEAVRNCFRDLRGFANRHPALPKIVNFPLIGCGLGGGDWAIVEAIIDEELDDSFTKILWTL